MNLLCHSTAGLGLGAGVHGGDDESCMTRGRLEVSRLAVASEAVANATTPKATIINTDINTFILFFLFCC